MLPVPDTLLVDVSAEVITSSVRLTSTAQSDDLAVIKTKHNRRDKAITVLINHPRPAG